MNRFNIANITSWPLVALDSETALIKAGLNAPPLTCVTVDSSESSHRWHRALYDHVQAKGVVFDLVERATAGEFLLVLQNGFFDFGVFCTEWPELLPLVFKLYDSGFVFDSMVAEWLLDTADGTLGKIWSDKHNDWIPSPKGNGQYSLKRLAQKYLNVELDKDTYRLKYGELRGVPIDRWEEGARKYAIEDAVNTRLVARAQLERAVKFKSFALRDLPAQCRAYWALNLITSWGIRTDGERVEKFAAQLKAHADELFPEIIKIGFLEQDKKGHWVAKSKILQDMIRGLYETAGKKPPLTATGKVQTSAEVLEDAETLFDVADPPPLKKYVQWKKTMKLVDTWLPLLRRGAVEPLHSRYGFTITGRTSAYGDLNIQQLDRKEGLRECFHAGISGWVMSSTDYNMLELCTWAQVCLWIVKSSKLAEAINAGMDVHLMVASKIVGISYEEAVIAKKAGDKRIKDMRQVAKILNFGLPAGMGFDRIVAGLRSQGVVMPKEDKNAPIDAKRLKAFWLATWPEAEHYFEWVKSKVGFGESTELVHFISGRLRGNLGFSDLANITFQALAVDGAKAATWQVVRECYDPTLKSVLLGSRVLAMVHDELIGAHRQDVASACAKRISEIMVSSMKRYTPDVKIEAPPALMRHWSKSAEPTFDARGELIPFEDGERKAT